MGYMEAMAMGLPTIGTNGSSHLDFMNQNNSFLIDVIAHEPLRDDTFHHLTSSELFMRPSVDHLRKLMRYVVEHPAEAKLRADAAMYVRDKYSTDAVARLISDELSTVAAVIGKNAKHT